MTTNHLILDFSHVYCDEKIPKNDRVHWLDCSDIAECDLYCSKRAEEEIRVRIEPYGIRGIHFLDSGNYHYVTGIMTEQIKINCCNHGFVFNTFPAQSPQLVICSIIGFCISV